MFVSVQRDVAVPGVWQQSRVMGRHLMAQTTTMTRLASGRSEGGQTGRGQGSVACHYCSAGHLVVVAVDLESVKEAVGEAPTGLEVGQDPLVQDRHLVAAAGEVHGDRVNGESEGHAEVPKVKKDAPPHPPEPGRYPVDAIQAGFE